MTFVYWFYGVLAALTLGPLVVIGAVCACDWAAEKTVGEQYGVLFFYGAMLALAAGGAGIADALAP